MGEYEVGYEYAGEEDENGNKRGMRTWVVVNDPLAILLAEEEAEEELYGDLMD